MAPVGSFHVRPPLKVVVEGDGMTRRRKNNGAGHQVLRRRPGKVFSSRGALRDGYVSGGLYEFAELGIRNIRLVHVEPVYVNTMDRTRIRCGLHANLIHVWRVVCAHGKFSSGNPEHVLWSACGSGIPVLDCRQEFGCGLRAGVGMSATRNKKSRANQNPSQ